MSNEFDTFNFGSDFRFVKQPKRTQITYCCQTQIFIYTKDCILEIMPHLKLRNVNHFSLKAPFFFKDLFICKVELEMKAFCLLILSPNGNSSQEPVASYSE